jgi:hypothetical protein
MTYEQPSSAAVIETERSRARSSTPPETVDRMQCVRDLEDLRDCVLRRLGQIEELARRPGIPSEEIARLERALEERIKELDVERVRLRSHAEQEHLSVKQVMVDLEKDKILLTNAWERLERERIDGGAARQPAGSSPRPAEPATPHVAPASHGALGGDTGNPVAETMLRQFQTLCNDVRRTRESRCSPR